MPSINKARLIDVVNRSMTRCYVLERGAKWEYPQRTAVSKKTFKQMISDRSEYDLEVTLRFSGYDVELKPLDEIKLKDDAQRWAVMVWIGEKMAEYGLQKPCQLDFVDSLWVDKASLIMHGMTGAQAANVIMELLELGAIEKLSADGPILLKPAAWRTAQREEWNLENDS